jgi:anti-anti-sigma factor
LAVLKFKIVRPTETRLVIKVRGEFSNSKIAAARQKMSDAILELPVGGTAAFESSEISHIDSMGISALIDFYDSAKKRKITIEIQNPSEYVLKMLKLVKVDRLFRIIS